MIRSVRKIRLVAANYPIPRGLPYPARPLLQHWQRNPDMPETRSTCCYCGVGCGVIIEHDGRFVTGVRGDPDHPANFGRLCTKGSTLHLSAAPSTLAARALHPE